MSLQLGLPLTTIFILINLSINLNYFTQEYFIKPQILLIKILWNPFLM